MPKINNMIEKIYSDFTTQLLPKINSGLQITKDYFLDIFGRYVKYLIISDIFFIVVGLFISLIAIITFLIFKNKLIAKYKKEKEKGWGGDVDGIYVAFILMSIVFCIGLVVTISNTYFLIRDIYLPEISVISDLSSYMQGR